MENSEAPFKSEIPKETKPNKQTYIPTSPKSNSDDSTTNADTSIEQPALTISPAKELSKISNDESQKISTFTLLQNTTNSPSPIGNETIEPTTFQITNEASETKMVINIVQEHTGPPFSHTNSSEIVPVQLNETPTCLPRERNSQMKSFIDISSLKTSLKRKLNLPSFVPNIEKQTFIQRETIAEQKAQTFYVDPFAQNTTNKYLYPYKYTLRNNDSGQIKRNNSYNKIQNTTSINKTQRNQDMKKIQTIGSVNKNNQRFSKYNKKASIASNKKSQTNLKKVSEINQKMKKNQKIASIYTTETSYKKPMASTLSTREVFIAPNIPQKNSKPSKIIPLNFFPLKETDEAVSAANSIKLVSKSPQSSTESKQTDEIIETVTATENIKSEGDYFACFQTVKSSQVSSVSAVANITQLTEISPARLLDASENIMESNTEIIQLINKLTEALKIQQDKNAAAGKISFDVSKNALEEALLYALGKRPRTITIIRRATEPTSAIGKPTIYVQQLDVALKKALGNNPKLVSFVKKLITTSVTNYIKANPHTTKPGEINLDNITSQESPVISVSNFTNTERENLESKVDEITSNEENVFEFESIQKYPVIGRSVKKENEFKETQLTNEIRNTNEELLKVPIPLKSEYFSNSDKEIEENLNFPIAKKNVFKSLVPIASYSKYSTAPEVQVPITKKNKINISSIQIIRKPQLAITSVLQKIKNPPKEFYKNVSSRFGLKPNNPDVSGRLINTNSNFLTPSGTFVNNYIQRPIETKVMHEPASLTSETFNSDTILTKPPTISSNCTNLMVEPKTPNIFQKIFGLKDKLDFNSLNPNRFKISPAKLPNRASAIENNQKLTVIKKISKGYPIKETISNAVNTEENISTLETEEVYNTLELANNQGNSGKLSSKQLIKITKHPESSKIQNGNTYRKLLSSAYFEEIPKKRFKLSYSNAENLDVSFQTCQNTASISQIPTPKEFEISNEMLEKKTDFSLLQANIKSILESGIFKQTSMDNIHSKSKEISSEKLDESELERKSSFEEKDLHNFSVMHAALKSIIDSSEYQEMLILANTNANANAPEHTSNSINNII